MAKKKSKKKSYVRTPLLTKFRMRNYGSVSYKGLIEEIEALVKANGGRIPDVVVGYMTFILKNETTKQAVATSTDDLYLYSRQLKKDEILCEALDRGDDIQIELFSVVGTRESAIQAINFATAKIKVLGEYEGWKSLQGDDPYEIDAQTKFMQSLYEDDGVSLNAYYAATAVGAELFYPGISKTMMEPRQAVIFINDTRKRHVTLGRCADNVSPWEAATVTVLTDPELCISALQSKVLIRVVGLEELSEMDPTGEVTLDEFYNTVANNLTKGRKKQSN